MITICKMYIAFFPHIFSYFSYISHMDAKPPSFSGSAKFHNRFAQTFLTVLSVWRRPELGKDHG